MNNVIGVKVAFQADTKAAEQQMKRLQNQLYKITSTTPSVGQGTKLASDLSKAQTAAVRLQGSLQAAFNTDTGRLNLTQFEAQLKRSGTSVSQLRQQLLATGADGRAAVQQLNIALAQGERYAFNMGATMSKLKTTLANTVRWQASSALLTGFTSAIQSALRYVEDLNNSLNDIRIVTGYSADEMDAFGKAATAAAKALSTTTTAYTKASLIYFQQGLNMQDVQKRTEVTIKMANVTGQSVETISDQLTAVWNNFDNGTKSLEYYADVITALGAATASSAEEITQGLEKFAAVAETVGLSYEYATAALATVTATTRQSADIVGTAFKTLFSRIQDLELGETLDDGTTLGQYSKALDAVGISITDATGEVRDMNDILDEMGSKWNTLSQSTKLAVAQSVAGVRQYTQLIALMDNWSEFQDNLNIAKTSEGSLTEQAEIYEEGWKAASKRITASIEEVWNALLDDETFIKIMDGFADFISWISDAIDAFGGLETVILGLTAVLFKMVGPSVMSGLSSMGAVVKDMASSKLQGMDNKVGAYFRSRAEQQQREKDIGFESQKIANPQNAMDRNYNSQVTSTQQFYTNLNKNLAKATPEQQAMLEKNRQAFEGAYNAAEATNDAARSSAQNVAGFQRNVRVETSNMPNPAILQLQEQERQLQASYNSAKGRLGAATKQLNAANASGQADVTAEEKSVEAAREELEKYKALLEEVRIKKKEVAEQPLSEQQIQNARDLSNTAINTYQQVGRGETLFENVGMQDPGQTGYANAATEQVFAAATHMEGVSARADGQGWQVDAKALGLSEVKDGNDPTSISQAEAYEGLLNSLDQVIQKSKEAREAADAVNDLEKKEIKEDDSEDGKRLTAAKKQSAAKEAELDAANKRYQDSVEAMDEANQKTRQLADSQKKQAVEAGVSAERMEQGAEAALEFGKQEEMASLQTGKLAAQTENLNTSNDKLVISYKSAGQQLMSVFGAISQMAMGVQMLKGAWETISNPDVSGWDKVMTTLTTIGFAIPMLVNGMTALNAATGLGTIISAAYAAMKGKETFATGLNAAAIELENKNKQKGIILTLIQKALSNKVLAITLLIIAALALLAGGIFLIAQAMSGPTDALKDAREEAERANKAYENQKSVVESLTKVYEDLKSSLEGYEKAQKSLDTLVEGTREWREALRENNQYVRDMIAAYPELAKYVTSINGELQFVGISTDEILNKAEAKVIEAENVKLQAEFASKQANLNLDRTELAEKMMQQKDTDDIWYILGLGYEGAKLAQQEEENLTKLYSEKLDKFLEEAASGKFDYNDPEVLARALEEHELNIDGIDNLEDTILSLIESDIQLVDSQNLLNATLIQNARKASGIGADKATSGVYSSHKMTANEKNYEIEAQNKINNIEGWGKNTEKSNFGFWEEYFKEVMGDPGPFKRINSGKGIQGSVYKIQNMDDRDKVEIEPINGGDKIEIYEDDAEYSLKNAYVADIKEDYGTSEEAIKQDNALGKVVRSLTAKEVGESEDAYTQRLQALAQSLTEGKADITLFSREEIAGLMKSTTKIDDLQKILKNAGIDDIDLSKLLSENNLANYEEIRTRKNKQASKGYDPDKELAVAQNKALQAAGATAAELDTFIKQYSSYGDAAEEVAQAILDTTVGVGSLAKTFNKYSGALVKAKEGTFEYAQGLNALDQNLYDWFGVDFDDTWIKNNIDVVKQAAQGIPEAIEVVALEAADILKDKFDFNSEEKNLFAGIEKGLKQDLFKEGTSNIYQYADAINDAIASGAINTDQAVEMLERYGFAVATIIGKDGKKYIDGAKTVWMGYQSTVIEGLDALGKEIKNRYHYVKEQLSDLERHYDKIGEAKDKAFGKDKLSLMQQEIDTLNQLEATQDSYVEEIVENLKTDAAALKVFLNPGDIDEFGRVKQEAIDRNAGNEEFEKVFKQYVETLNLWEAEHDKLDEYASQKMEAEIAKIEYKAEIKIGLAEDSLKTLEYQIEKLGDGFDKVADAINLYGEELKAYDAKNQATRNELEERLTTKGFSKESIEKIFAGNIDDSVFKDSEGKALTLDAADIEALRQYKEDIISYEKAAREAFKKVSESIISAADDYNEKLEKNTDAIKRYGEVAGNVRNIVDLLGGALKGSDKIIATLSNQSVESAKAAATAARIAVVENNENLKEAQDARDAYIKEQLELNPEFESDEVVEEWDKTIEALTEDVANAEDNWTSTISESLQAMADAFETSMDQIFKTFESTAAGISGTFENLQEQFDREKEKSELYLKDYEKVYELSKLNRNIMNSIDETDSVKAKQRLAELQEELNELSEDNRKVSQYELDNLQAQYDLRLAEIALEEAQNAKSQVRMSRDNEGNWSYVYTADESKIDKARQDYEDKLFAAQTLQQDYIQTSQDNLVQLEVERTEALRAIMEDTTLSAEQKEIKLEETNKHYNYLMEYWTNQLKIVLDDAKLLYENDMTAYSEATNAKLLSEEAWVDSFSETILKTKTGYETLEGYAEKVKAAAGTLVSKLTEEAKTYQSNLETVMENAGASIKLLEGPLNTTGTAVTNFGTKVTTMASNASTAIGDEKSGLIKKLNDLGATDAFSKIVNSADTFYDSYETIMGDYISQNQGLITSIDEVIKKYEELETAAGKVDVNRSNDDNFKPESTGKPLPEIEIDKKAKYSFTAYDNKMLANTENTEDFSNISGADITKAQNVGNGVAYLEWTKDNKDYSGYVQVEEFGLAYAPENQKATYTYEPPNENDDEYREYMLANGEAITETIYGADEKPKYYIMSGKSSNKLIPVKIIDDLKAANKGFYDGHGRTLYDPNDFLPEVPDKIEINLDKKQSFTRYNKPSAEATHTTRKPYDHEDSQLINNIENGYVQLTDISGMWNWVTLNQLKSLKAFDTGGYTGSWDSSGRLAMLHQKELVLNAADTENFLVAVNIVRDIASAIDLRAIAQQSALSMLSYLPTPQNQSTLQQEVTITAEFPNATDRNEIEEAFKSLVNHASQFANRAK